MNRIPNWLKWLVVALVFALMGAAVLAVDRRASRVDMPDPDNTFGIYREADACPPIRSITDCQKSPVQPTCADGRDTYREIER